MKGKSCIFMNKFDIKDLQELLYELLNNNILKIDGTQIENDEGMIDELVSKADLADAVVTVLNKFGKEMEKLNEESKS